MESLRHTPKWSHPLELWGRGINSPTLPAHPLLLLPRDPALLFVLGRWEGAHTTATMFHIQRSTTHTATACSRQQHCSIVVQDIANTPRSQQSKTWKEWGCYFIHKQQHKKTTSVQNLPLTSIRSIPAVCWLEGQPNGLSDLTQDLLTWWCYVTQQIAGDAGVLWNSLFLFIFFPLFVDVMLTYSPLMYFSRGQI